MFAAGIVCTGIVLPLAVIADVVTARGYIVGVEEGFTAHAVGWTCSAFESFRTGRAKTYTLG